MTPRQLGILSALVVVLAAITALDRRGPRRVDEDVPVLAGVPLDALERLVVGDATLVAAGAELALEGGPAVDEDAVRELRGALGSLAVRARVPAADAAARGLEPARATLTLRAGGRDVTLALGGPAPGGRRWVVVSTQPGVHLVVDEHQARALEVDREALRRHRAFAHPDAGAIVLARAGAAFVTIEAPGPDGTRCVRVGAGCARADEAAVAGLAQRLAGLRVVAAPGQVAPTAPALTIQAGGETLVVGAVCTSDPSARVASGAAGVGCVAGANVTALEAVEPTVLVDRAPMRARDDLTGIVITAGGRRLALTIDRAGARVEGGGAADADAVADWVRELGATRARAVISSAPGPAVSTLVLAEPGRSTTLELLAAGAGEVRVRRAGELVALVLPADAARFFVPEATPFGDRTLLSFEPSALRAVETDVEVLRRGATLDDWSLVRPVEAPVDADARARLVDAASQLTAVRLLPRGTALGVAPAGVARRLAFVLDPPPTAADGAPPSRVELELGGPAPGGGCLARARGVEAVVSDEDCEALRVHLGVARLLDDREAITALVLDGVRWERGAGRWLAAGAPVGERDGRRIDALLAALADPVETVGYGRAMGHALTLETAAGTRALVVGRGEASLASGGIRAALPLALCEAWPALCRP